MKIQYSILGGYTPLIMAAIHKKFKIYQVLLHTYGADPDWRDYSGYKAKHYLPGFQENESLDEVDHNSTVDVILDKSKHFLRDLVHRESKRKLQRPKSHS